MLTFLVPWSGNAQKSLFDLLYRPDSVFEIGLRCEWDSVMVLRRTDTEVDGKFFFQKRSGEMVELKAGISSRGKFRRRICDFPPIRLEFSKKELREMGLLPLDNMKLVTHCRIDSLSYERIAKEYLIYRMYQLVSPYSFRAQLVEVKYLDIDPSRPTIIQHGVLLEDDRVLAQRTGIERRDTMGLSPAVFQDDIVDVHALFQYLIGNSDWSLAMSRNLNMFFDKGSGRFILVPFDFDFSGLVNASYAIPNSDYKLKTLRQRVYLGGSPPSESARNKVLAQKKAIIDLIKKSRFLSPEAQLDCILYLNSGFRDIKKNKLAFPEM